MNTGQIIKDLVQDEGLRLKPYKDTVGKLTIGIGRNLDDVGISEEEAYHLCENDLKACISDLQTLSCFDGLPYDVQRVLVNMRFNLGFKGLLGFRNTLALIQEGKYKEASYSMLDSKWAKQVGARAYRLSEILRNAK